MKEPARCRRYMGSGKCKNETPRAEPFDKLRTFGMMCPHQRHESRALTRTIS